MSDFDVARWRPAPFLPESDARDGSLTFVVAVLCFLACLTLLAVLAADRAARDWTDQLEGQATIIVRPKANETPDGAAASFLSAACDCAGAGAGGVTCVCRRPSMIGSPSEGAPWPTFARASDAAFALPAPVYASASCA